MTKQRRGGDGDVLLIVGALGLGYMLLTGTGGALLGALTGGLSSLLEALGLGAAGKKILDGGRKNDDDNNNSGSSGGSGGNGGGSSGGSSGPSAGDVEAKKILSGGLDLGGGNSVTKNDFSSVSDPFSSPDLSKIKSPSDADVIRLHSTGSPTTGSSGILPENLIKAIPTSGKPTTGSKGILPDDLLKVKTPSKSGRPKKSDNKKSHKTNDSKKSASPPAKKDCGFLGLGCALDNLKGALGIPITPVPTAPAIPLLA